MTGSALEMAPFLSGGRAAISGFLFQFVISLGFVVDAEAVGNQSVPGSHIDILFKAIRKAGLHVEKHDSDALTLGVDATDENVVVQIKYSNDANNNVSESELKKICASVNQQIGRIKLIDQKDVQKAIFVTNRNLSTDARKRMEEAIGKKPRGKNWNAEGWAVLANLEFKKLGGLQTGYESIEKFGARFGASRVESATATDGLIGRILERITNGKNVRLDRQQIVEAIVQSADASYLYADSSAENSLREVDDFWKKIDSTSLSMKYFRSALIQEIDECAANAAFVAIVGNGGDGKTCSAVRWVHERIKSDTNATVRLAGISHARWVTGSFARDCFRTWLGMKDALSTWPSSLESVTDVINRCSRGYSAQLDDANISIPLTTPLTSAGPYFVLVVDGIDELSKIDSSDLTRLLRHFEAEQKRIDNNPGTCARAILVVTCRSERELRNMLSEFQYDAEFRPKTIKASGFSNEELIEVASVLDQEVSSRLQLGFSYQERADATISTSRELPVPNSEAGTIGESSVRSTLRPAKPAIAKALQHPALWKCFALLPASERFKILDEDLQALNELACQFLQWAVSKCSSRNSHKGHFEDLNIVDHLVAAGELSMQYSATGSAPHSIWRETYLAASHHEVGPSLGFDLESSGVISYRDAKTWWWRHPFVGRLFESADVISELREWARPS